jgi:hypothetical protein
MAYKCGNCGKDGHNRRTCPGLTTAQRNAPPKRKKKDHFARARFDTEFDTAMEEMAAKPSAAKAKGSHRPCFLCAGTDHTPKNCDWAALVRAGNGLATDEDLVIVCTRIRPHRGGNLLVHMLAEGEGRSEIRTYVRDHIDPRVYMGVEAEVGLPVFSSFTEMAQWWKDQAEKDGKGPDWHRPCQLELEYARRAWPYLLTAEPKVYPKVEFA